jgi:hypothetical protein
VNLVLREADFKGFVARLRKLRAWPGEAGEPDVKAEPDVGAEPVIVLQKDVWGMNVNRST